MESLTEKRFKCAICRRYHELFGAVDFNQLMELKERNTPKEAIYEGDGCPDEETFFDTWICPNCGAEYDVDDDYNFCPDCGQMILR